jgi:hypothetical protein
MKIGKGLALLVIAAIFGSCFDPPEFPNVPEIAFEGIEFYDGASTDSLVLSISFKDGDGDLGLSGEDPLYISSPYDNPLFYQTTGNGKMIPIHKDVYILQEGDTLNLLNIENPNAGDLVFPRTRKQPGYDFLPVFVPPGCPDYEFQLESRLYIEQADSAVLDKFVDIIDTLRFTNATFYEILDTLYVTTNPEHYNIEVDFLVKDPNSTHPDHPGFTEFDWREEYCVTFDGRFPVLSDSESALEGTLRYSMNSTGFLSIFGLDTPLMLRVQIKDRARNQSNVIFTKVFTLQQI